MPSDHLILNDRESVARALLGLVARAHGGLRLYASAFDSRLFNRPTLETALGRLAIRSTRTQVRILSGDPHNLFRDAARLVALARDFPSRVGIRGFNDQENAPPPGFFCLADDRWYLGCKEDHPVKYECNELESARAGQLAREFDKWWEESLPLTGLHVIGL